MKLTEMYQKELFKDLGKPQTVYGVYQRMIIRALDANDKRGFLSDCLCHSTSIDYLIANGQATNMLVMVGLGNRVHHSFVTDFHGTIIKDSLQKTSPVFTGKSYMATSGKMTHKMKVMFHKPWKDIKKDLAKVKGTQHVTSS